MRPVTLLSCAAVVSIGAIVFGITLARARPPQAGAVQPASAPLVGHVRTRDAILELTVESVGQGGPAHEVGRGVANVIADVEPVARPAPSASGAAPSPGPAEPRW